MVPGARFGPWDSWPFWVRCQDGELTSAVDSATQPVISQGRDAGLPRTNTYWNLAIRVSSSDAPAWMRNG